jgi:hypothetical protein
MGAQRRRPQLLHVEAKGPPSTISSALADVCDGKGSALWVIRADAASDRRLGPTDHFEPTSARRSAAPS